MTTWCDASVEGARRVEDDILPAVERLACDLDTVILVLEDEMDLRRYEAYLKLSLAVDAFLDEMEGDE